VAAAATAVTLAAPPAAETALAADSVSGASGPGNPAAGQINMAQSAASNQPITTEQTTGDWTKPVAMAIPKEWYFTLEQGRYGAVFPKTPANYGFTVIAK